MTTPTIFKFADYREYLKVAGGFYLTRRKRPITLDKWAEKLGYRSPRSIAMVLKGQRQPSSEMIFKISKEFDLNKDEQRYFELLVMLERKRKIGNGVQEVFVELEKINPNIPDQVAIDSKTFSYIAEWYHLVIKQLVGTPRFREDANWIRQRLRQKVTIEEVLKAKDTMLKLQILERDPKIRSLKVSGRSLITGEDVPAAANRLHHKEMMDRAKEALEEQEVDNREFTSVTIQFDPSKLSEAKSTIRKFRDQFHKKFYSNNGEGVFQFNLQFFEHTMRTKR